MRRIDQLFHGQAIELKVRGTRHSPAQAEAIRQIILDAEPAKLRYNCVIAEALNESLNGGPTGTPSHHYGLFDIKGKLFQLNPKGRSQFYMSPQGEPCLTTSLVDVESGTRYGFTWRGENVPQIVQETAVAHDQGQDTKLQQVMLSFDLAEKHIIGAKNGTPKNDPRPNHDTAKNGKPYPRRPRRHHRRLSSADLVS